MSALHWLKAAGASVTLKDEKRITVGNLDRMDHETAERVINVARQNKPVILAELKGEPMGGWVQ